MVYLTEFPVFFCAHHAHTNKLFHNEQYQWWTVILVLISNNKTNGICTFGLGRCLFQSLYKSIQLLAFSLNVCPSLWRLEVWRWAGMKKGKERGRTKIRTFNVRRSKSEEPLQTYVKRYVQIVCLEEYLFLIFVFL